MSEVLRLVAAGRQATGDDVQQLSDALMAVAAQDGTLSAMQRVEHVRMLLPNTLALDAGQAFRAYGQVASALDRAKLSDLTHDDPALDRGQAEAFATTAAFFEIHQQYPDSYETSLAQPTEGPLL